MTSRFLTFALCLSFCFAGTGWGQELAAPVWTPLGASNAVQEGECYFRKQFTLVRPERGELQLECSGRAIVYLNGQRVDLGMDAEAARNSSVSVSRLLKPGVNLIAVRVANAQAPSFLSAKLRIKEVDETTWRALITDETWLTHRDPSSGWQNSGYPDLSWVRARLCQPNVRLIHYELPVAPADSGLPTSVDNIPGRASRAQSYVKRFATSPDTSLSVDPAIEAPMPKHSGFQTAKIADTFENVESIEFNMLSPLESNPADNRNELTTYENPGADPEQSPMPYDSEPTAYQLPKGFVVEQILDPAETQSVLAMAINEFGLIVFSQEGGGLMIADPRLPSGRRVRSACTQVRNCQGILAFNGNLYVTGDGPEGLALYELVLDSNTNEFAVSRTLLRFTGQAGEHGPHGITIGPDGMLYVTVGSANYLAGEWPTNSPLNQSIDTDLLPKHEDPGGHARGVKAPGGTIVRVALNGTRREIVAGGLRNVYDLTFNSCGDLFVHDADMESDIGLPWYQPTMLYHVAHGADMGWRSGWSRLQPNLVDTIPPVVNTGRGSPTGAVCYRHVQFPVQYHDALFLGDWSAGRILAVRMTRKGSTYSGQSEVFLQAQPLNVTDLEIGEDGSLYFCTGGRGTRGGVFRIRWTGPIPHDLLTFPDNVARVVRHPQPSAAWTRQNLAVLSQTQDSSWSGKLLAAARDRSYPPSARAQALEAVVFYCGLPEIGALADLGKDYSEIVRAKLAHLCGFDDQSLPLLDELLNDSSNFVVRHACESYLRLGKTPSVEQLIRVLARCHVIEMGSSVVASSRTQAFVDRHLQTVVRRLLERIPCDNWIDQLDSLPNTTDFVQLALAIASAQATAERCDRIVAACCQRLTGRLSDDELVEVLRLVEIALSRSPSDSRNLHQLATTLEQRFPSGDERVNRQLATLIVFLREYSTPSRFSSYLTTAKDSIAAKTWVAMQLARGADWLDDTTRLAVIDTLHLARSQNTAGTYRLYLQAAIRETAETVSDANWLTVLEKGAQWVDALVPIFYKIQSRPSDIYVRQLIELDRQLHSLRDDSATQARLGIIALLSQAGDESAFEHLRWCWRNEPKRRNELALGLSRKPDGKNWSYLVTSLSELDDLTCEEVVNQLITIPLRPSAAEHYRQLLEMGYRLQDAHAHKVGELMEHWTQIRPEQPATDWKNRLDLWRDWYQQQWPNEKPVSMPVSEKVGRYSVEQILQHWSTASRTWNSERGQQVFVQTNCAQCHRVGAVGDSVGPDLTALARRFSRREAVEAIVDPNKTVPDRYRSSIVVDENGNQYVGLLTDNGDSYTILLADGNRVRVHKDSVDQVRSVETSVMPSGLLDRLSLDDITDLMVYLMGENESTGQLGQITDEAAHR